MQHRIRNCIYSYIRSAALNCPDDKTLLPVPEPLADTQLAGASLVESSAQAARTDRLYQIAAVAVGLILLATAL